MIRLRGGRVVDPTTGMDEVTDVYLQGGTIAALGRAPRGIKVQHDYDVSGLVVAPGLVDLGSFLVRRSLTERVKWPGDDQLADGRYIQALAAIARRVVAVERPLFVHN